DHVTIVPWADPLIDPRGHDPRSAYVERFWLSTLGPTATLLMRRLADAFDRHPDGFVLDLAVTAQSLGLSRGAGRSGAFVKAFGRCVMFGLAHQCSTGYAARRRLPAVARRHLLRLPAALQEAHDAWPRGADEPPGVRPLPS